MSAIQIVCAEFGSIAAISIFLGGLNFGLFYVGLGLGSGSMSAVAYQRHALHRPVSLAAARGEAVSHHVRSSAYIVGAVT